MKLVYGGLAECSNERSRYWIARRDAKDADDADVLVLRLPDGRTAMPVFDREEEAGMFVWLETTGEGWRVAELSASGLLALLRGSCAGVRRIVYPFVADGVGKGPATVDRDDFLRALSGAQSRRGEVEAHEFRPRTSARNAGGS